MDRQWGASPAHGGNPAEDHPSSGDAEAGSHRGPPGRLDAAPRAGASWLTLVSLHRAAGAPHSVQHHSGCICEGDEHSHGGREQTPLPVGPKMKVPRAPAPAPSPQGLQGPSVPCLRRRLTQLQVLTRQPRLVRQGLTHSPRALTPRCSLAPGRQPGVPGGGVGDRPGAGLSPRRGEATRERPQGNEGNRGAVLGTRGLRGRHTQTPRPSWHTRPSSPARPSADSRSELLGTFRQVRIGPRRAGAQPNGVGTAAARSA